MSISVEIPGAEPLRSDYLLLDVNGTLTDRGTLIEGVEERLVRLREALEVRLLSADTFGGLDAIAARLGLEPARVTRGEEKLAYVERVGADRCAAIGNGGNDEAMLEAARLGLAVVGGEGASAATIRAADVVCGSILDALDLLASPDALAATLRP